jgi:hypothetical protein
MTATKLLTTYVYQAGQWEARDPDYGNYSFELWNGTHDDEVCVCGYEDGGDLFIRLKVHGGFMPSSAEMEHPEQCIEYSSRYSAAWKWGYTHAVLYGIPRMPHEPHVVVLEIAEDAFEGDEHVSPYPYLVYVNLGFTTHTVFTDGFADLVRLLGEVLPIVGNPAPRDVDVYQLHKWQASYGQTPIK